MKHTFVFILLISLAFSCNSTKPIVDAKKPQTEYNDEDKVTIANEALEYEIIIIEPGFNAWLASTARPEGFYSQSFLESRNLIYVTEWNARVSQPTRFNPNLYEMRIDYQPSIDYGYEVNYKLYNYFIYFQLKYNQRLAGYIPRI